MVRKKIPNFATQNDRKQEMSTNNTQSLSQLRQEYDYFEIHRKEFSQKYPDLYLIIQDQQVLFALNTLSEAIAKASDQGLAEGSYLLQFCDKEGKKMVCTYRSRAHFK